MPFIEINKKVTSQKKIVLQSPASICWARVLTAPLLLRSLVYRMTMTTAPLVIIGRLKSARQNHLQILTGVNQSPLKEIKDSMNIPANQTTSKRSKPLTIQQKSVRNQTLELNGQQSTLGLALRWIVALLTSSALLAGCAQTPLAIAPSAVEQFALCQTNAQTQDVTNQIQAEHGFRIYHKKSNNYKPVLDTRVFGHALRMVSVDESTRKLYLSGNFLELKYHFKMFYPDMNCDAKSCQYTLPHTADAPQPMSFNFKTLKKEKIKDTVLIRCQLSTGKPLAEVDAAFDAL